jgi:hypothetical protein
MNHSSKAPHLPAPVAAYFAADKLDAETLSQCFTETAVVKDEGHTYNGRLEIKQWKTEASKKYEYTCEPFACEHKKDNIEVTSTLTGDFPGSPADLRFIFKLANDKIASLQIIPS